MNTIYSCGIKINPLSIDEVLNTTEQWFQEGRRNIQITGINIEQIALLSKNAEFSSYANSSDIVNIDGIVVYWYLRLKGYKLKSRCICADIFEELLQKANEKNRSIYLLGATQETIEQLVENLQQEYKNIRIVGYHNGYFSDEKVIVEDISSKKPDYLFIGMPSPFKERFITTYKESLGAGLCLGVGGMFDILAGKVQRAPEKVQKYGLEWLYRISQNPKGHSKRVLRALFPCMKIFIKYLFEPRKQQF